MGHTLLHMYASIYAEDQYLLGRVLVKGPTGRLQLSYMNNPKSRARDGRTYTTDCPSLKGERENHEFDEFL